jgi:hypothetical protein
MSKRLHAAATMVAQIESGNDPLVTAEEIDFTFAKVVLFGADTVMFDPEGEYLDVVQAAIYQHRWVLGGIASDKDIAQGVLKALQAAAKLDT